MKMVNYLSAAFVAVLISACGGGGGNSSPAPTTVPVVVVTPTPAPIVPVVTPTVPVPAMTCTSNAIWSNPAVFSTVFQDCIAPVGVQALVTSMNTMVDTTCVPTVGTPLSAACKAYMANGTILLADTSIMANNHALMWMAYIGVDTKSNLVLLDATTMMPIGAMVLPGDLLWIIGNPTGAAISEQVGTLLKSEQVKWDGASLAVTCYKNCQ